MSQPSLPLSKRLRPILLVGLLVALIGAMAFWANTQDSSKNTVSEKGIDAQETGACKRIVSLAPSVTEILYALDLGDEIVGVTRYCDYPPEAKTKPKVGGYYDPNLEMVYSLKPDLVVMLQEHQEQTRLLSSMGLQTMAINYHTLSGIQDSLKRVGQRCDKEKEANMLLSALESDIEHVQSKVAGRPKPRVLITIDRSRGTGAIKEVFIAGPGTFYDELIVLAGGINAYQSSTPIRFPSISKEGVLALNPQVIIDLVPPTSIGADMDKRRILKDWESLPQVDAVKNKRLFVFTDDYMVRPSPRFVLILKQFGPIIHPEADWSS